MTACRVLFLSLFAFTWASLADDKIREYDWLTNGVKSGSLVVTISEDGSRSSRFEFNDRGRGPDISERVHVGENGRLVKLDISGHSYMGAPVDERMWVEQGEVRWKSTLEEGAVDRSDGFYLANDGTPELTAALVRALLRSEGGTLNLLPTGKATISLLKGLELPGMGGQKIRLFAIHGISTEPEFIWLDWDSELFGLARGWMSLVPSGQAHLSELLQQTQDEAELAYHEQLSKPLTHALPARYTVRNVHLIDVETGEVEPGQSVTVADGKIVAIGEHAGNPGEAVIDGMGGWLMPGLWDMHSHISQEQGPLHIAAGVTTIRDMGNNPEQYFDVKRRFDDGTVVGPRSVAAGFIDRKSPYSAPIKKLAESLQDALDLVDEYAEMGYPQIKIYSSIEPDWVKPIAERVHGHGMRLSGHIPSYMTAERAIRDGFDEIQHINMLFLNFLAGPEHDTRTPVRFTLVAEHAGSLDLDSDEATAFFALMKQNDITVDPTVAVFDNMFRHRSGQLSPSYAMVADHFPPAMKRAMRAGRMNITDDNGERFASAADALLQMITKLHEHGIRIVAGTDALPGFTLHRELELYVQAGIPALEVLRLATLGSAEHMGQGEVSGSLAVGKRADMLLLSVNPLQDISAVRRVQLVFRGDRYFKSGQIYQAVGIRPFQ